MSPQKLSSGNFSAVAELGNASKRDDIPAFRAGDTVKVHVKVVEGSRSRVQIFQGVVIRVHGDGHENQVTVSPAGECEVAPQEVGAASRFSLILAALPRSSRR